MIREHYVDFRSARIFVRENLEKTGSLPVVLVHGLGSASSIYEPAFAEPFLAGRVLTFDFLGCGKSGKPQDYSYDMTEQAESLRVLFDHFKIEKANVVAHSMGGVISILFAAVHPERVERLMAAESNLDPANAKISRKIAEYGSEERFADGFDAFVGHYNRPNSPAAMRFYSTLVQTTPQALYRGAVSMVSLVTGDFYRSFLALPMPKAFIRGEESYQNLPERIRAEFVSQGIPIFSIPKAGHPMMEDAPEAFYAAVREFVDAPIFHRAP